MDKNTNISPNFKLYEFCSTSKGAKYVDLNAQHGIKHIDRLQALCTKIMKFMRNTEEKFIKFINKFKRR